MTPAPHSNGRVELAAPSHAALGFRLPALLDKLVSDTLADTAAQAELLFGELKKYLILCQSQPGLPMYSCRIDAVWHQFMLFTQDYQRFCDEHLGHFAHHEPELPGAAPSSAATSREQFLELYEQHFGAPSALWDDWQGLRADTRLRRPADDGVLRAVPGGDSCALVAGDPPAPLCRVGRRGHAALEFITRHRQFFIRELPGLRPADQLVLVCPLVQYGILHRAI